MNSILTSVSNLVWSNAEHSRVDCIIKTSQFGEEELPFTADINDVEPHGRAIFQDIVAGKYGGISEYTPPPVEEIVLNSTSGDMPITVL